MERLFRKLRIFNHGGTESIEESFRFTIRNFLPRMMAFITPRQMSQEIFGAAAVVYILPTKFERRML